MPQLQQFFVKSASHSAVPWTKMWLQLGYFYMIYCSLKRHLQLLQTMVLAHHEIITYFRRKNARIEEKVFFEKIKERVLHLYEMLPQLMLFCSKGDLFISSIILWWIGTTTKFSLWGPVSRWKMVHIMNSNLNWSVTWRLSYFLSHTTEFFTLWIQGKNF